MNHCLEILLLISKGDWHYFLFFVLTQANCSIGRVLEETRRDGQKPVRLAGLIRFLVFKGRLYLSGVWLSVDL